MEHTLVSMAVICALATLSLTLPQYRTYDTSVSGWFDIYMHRNVDFAATGSDIVAAVFWDERHVDAAGKWWYEKEPCESACRLGQSAMTSNRNLAQDLRL